MSNDNTVIEVTWEGKADQNRLYTLSEVFRRHCNVPAQAMIDVLLADDNLLADLNEKYRDIAEPTDVLAFEMGKDETDSDDHWILGQVVVSCNRAVEQARESGISFDEELAHLTVHGLLHLVGYDHDNDDARRKMDDIGDKILDEVFSGKTE